MPITHNPHLWNPGNKTTYTVIMTFKKPIHPDGSLSVGYEIDYDDNMSAKSLALGYMTDIIRANERKHLKNFRSAHIINRRTDDECIVYGKYYRRQRGIAYWF